LWNPAKKENLMKIVAVISQNPAPPPTPNFSEWGLGGAVAFLIVRELAQWFRRKEADESSLIKSLVESQQSQIQALVQSQQSQIQALTESQRQTADATRQLNEAFRAGLVELRRYNTESQQRQHNAAARLHERLDAIERKVVVPPDGRVERSRIPG
jgi:hypothetical protein